jgi:predicted nucleic acid-binding protein
LKALHALEKGTKIFVPAHWGVEVANGLIMAERRKRASQADITEALGLVAALPVASDEETTRRACSDTAALARQYGLTIYDAAYLELAMRCGATLATTDKALGRGGENRRSSDSRLTQPAPVVGLIARTIPAKPNHRLQPYRPRPHGAHAQSPLSRSYATRGAGAWWLVLFATESHSWTKAVVSGETLAFLYPRSWEISSSLPRQLPRGSISSVARSGDSTR